MKGRLLPDRWWRILAATALLGGSAAAGPAPRQVLAFYYGWYGNPEHSHRWVHWSEVDATNHRIGNSTHFPLLGAYDSHDPKVVEQHCRWAKEASLTGFIASWWGQKDFTDHGLPLLLDSAQRFGLNVTAYFETTHPKDSSARDNALCDVLYLLEKYGKHPAWLKVNGRPVLFVYGRAVNEIGLDGWRWVIGEANRRYAGGAVFIGDQISKNAAQVFDGIHTYNITGQTARKKSLADLQAWARTTFSQWVETAGERDIACLTIIPGYDDTKTGRPSPRPITDRRDGETYRSLWQEAVAANPDWVLVTSWNEWHEGTEIEPSLENGTRELRTTAEYATKFLGSKPRVATQIGDAAGVPKQTAPQP
jgi:glycoprotein endo-alpha-1,2-mannosidase